MIHRIGHQIFKNNLGYIPKAVESLFISNSDIHNYNTRNRDKMRVAYGKHKFMCKNFCVGTFGTCCIFEGIIK